MLFTPPLRQRHAAFRQLQLRRFLLRLIADTADYARQSLHGIDTAIDMLSL